MFESFISSLALVLMATVLFLLSNGLAFVPRGQIAVFPSPPRALTLSRSTAVPFTGDYDPVDNSTIPIRALGTTVPQPAEPKKPDEPGSTPEGGAPGTRDEDLKKPKGIFGEIPERIGYKGAVAAAKILGGSFEKSFSSVAAKEMDKLNFNNTCIAANVMEKLNATLSCVAARENDNFGNTLSNIFRNGYAIATVLFVANHFDRKGVLAAGIVILFGLFLRPGVDWMMSFFRRGKNPNKSA